MPSEFKTHCFKPIVMETKQIIQVCRETARTRNISARIYCSRLWHDISKRQSDFARVLISRNFASANLVARK